MQQVNMLMQLKEVSRQTTVQMEGPHNNGPSKECSMRVEHQADGRQQKQNHLVEKSWPANAITKYTKMRF